MPFPLLDPAFQTELTGITNAQTLAFVKKIVKGILYPDLSIIGRNVTGQVRYGEGTSYPGSISVNIQCDEVITVTTGTVTNTGNQSVQVTTTSGGAFAFSVAGSQGATVRVTVLGGITDTIIVGSGGTGGGGGGGGGTIGLPINESDVTNLVSDLAGKVPTTRQITTNAPLTGGGDLSGDLIFDIDEFDSSNPGVVPASGGAVDHFLCADGTWTSPVGIWGANSAFGDGSDGDVTLSGNITLSRDMFYNNLDLAGHNLDPNGWQVYVLGTLTFNGGKITANGVTGARRLSGSLPGSTLPGSGGGGGGVFPATGSSSSAQAPLEFFVSGVIGGVGVAAGAHGTNGNIGTNYCCGGSGASGGGGVGPSSTGAGVSGGTHIGAQFGASTHNYFNAFFGRSLSGTQFSDIQSGAGGTGGGTSSPPFGQPDQAGNGGAGGGGAGWVSVAASKIVGNGVGTIIEAKGADGQAGAPGTGLGGGGGGGGGAGAGGFVCLVFSTATNVPSPISSAVNVSGGTGGIGGTGGGSAGTGGNGGDGSSGIVRYFTISSLVSGPGATLPIAETDVTNLTTDLATIATKTPLSRLINATAPVRIDGGASADLSADRTISVNQFSSTDAGLVPASGGGTTNYLRADGTWNAPAGGGGSGAFRGAWSNAVPYGTGDLVSRGPFVFGCVTGNTGSDPCSVYDDFSDTAVWQRNGAGSSITNGIECILVNNVNGTSSTLIRQSVESYSWASKRFIVDALLGGNLTANTNADALNFGFIDGAVASTGNSTGIIFTGAWGVNLDTWNRRVTPIVNGVLGTPVSLNDILSYATFRYVRYFLDVVDNGVGAGTCTMTLYRETYPKGRQVQVTSFTVTRPTFTNFKFGIGGWSGGSAGTFKVRGAWIRDISNSNWTWVSDGPTIPNP